MVTEILETEIIEQNSIRYKTRYKVIVITQLYYYELIYRLHTDFEPHMTVSRMTYGKIHETQSGFTRVLENKNAVINHSHKTVYNMESRLEH